VSARPGEEHEELPEVEATSLLGEALVPPELPEEVYRERYARFEEAEEVMAADPDDADALIWLGRRTAYLGAYRDAIDIYSHALSLHPDDARLYRHRGHRYLTVREMDNAIADFREGVRRVEGHPDQVEPDGLPNARGIPTSTLQFNIWYHLGLAHYVKGEFEEAADAYAACWEVSAHPDSKVATAYWWYLTLHRLGRDADAAAVLARVHEGMDVIEGTGYLDLLLLFKGERDVGQILGSDEEGTALAGVTTRYGVGAWHLLNGQPSQAEEIFRGVLAQKDQWAAFGYLAAEAEVARMTKPSPSAQE